MAAAKGAAVRISDDTRRMLDAILPEILAAQGGEVVLRLDAHGDMEGRLPVRFTNGPGPQAGDAVTEGVEGGPPAVAAQKMPDLFPVLRVVHQPGGGGDGGVAQVPEDAGVHRIQSALLIGADVVARDEGVGIAEAKEPKHPSSPSRSRSRKEPR